MYQSLDEIRQANRLRGGVFFTEARVSHWRRKALPDLYGGRFFITAEYADELGSLHSARHYRVNEAKKDGTFPTARDARRYITGKLLGNDRFVQHTINWGL
jgi:hypothetical protein